MKKTIAIVSALSSVMLYGGVPAAAKDEVKKGVCAIVAGATSHSNFATIKCYLNESPGNYVIRRTVFERDDKKEYRGLARFAGRKIRCDFTVAKKTRELRTITTHYELSNCR